MQLIKSREDIKLFFEKSLEQKALYDNHDNLMVEPYINGRELTVSVIEEKGVSKPIDVTEIISKNLFFDYKAKYSKGFSKHILPANIPDQIYEQLVEWYLDVH